MKKLLFAVAVIIISASVNAQNLEIGANVGTGTKTGATTTYGVDGQVNIKAAEKFAVTGSVGYQNSNFKAGNLKYDNSFLLTYAGALVTLMSKLQAHPQLGYASNITSGHTGGHFSYAVSLLYFLTSSLNLGVKYMSIDTYNAVMLRLAYVISLKK